VFVFVIARLLPRLSEFLSASQAVVAALPAYASYRQFGQSLRELAPTVPDGRISFAGIHCDPGHIEAASLTFEGAPLEFRKGEITAICGPTGAGKTTLCDVLSGLLPAREWRVDGVVADQPALIMLRAATRYVPQDAKPWQRRVREVLQWANQEAGEDAMWKALEEAGLADRIRSSPEGLNVSIGDGGRLLSGGEIQRLMLAQALMVPVQLLVLDEITSALDEAMEKTVLSALQRIKVHTAVVLSTHREQAIAVADRVIQLEPDRGRQRVRLNPCR
jgi:ABC-type multidrug transport system fused ATPase/permease subunit